ncbi:hypothetical protein [Bacillus toyonensis]|uniref:hypothetical protein n=1 Tax=Bacillus toyonensis TaxID=155322 RepID=UPI000279647D|nr:hypothetical protein [Bacillus toyonensis]EJQ72239.1 hypothetical protein IGK_05615 [Bacillus toyonensis]QWG98547.1 hypothetical protein EXW33_28430 [Bacillus toyonensis]HDR7226162.1 hypothetical protein [Bacillus toyonensis]HDR7839236.1 hypothetical protein [Bacillus toyonensis]
MVGRIARYLVDHWNGLNKWVKRGIEEIASYAIVEAIVSGYQATKDYLSDLSSSAINAIASLLGL